MALVSKIGPLELSIFSLLGVLFLYRIQAAPESRIATALVFILSARFGSSFIDGFSIAQATELSFGQIDTIVAYVMLAFAFLEAVLLKRSTKWKRSDLWFLSGLLGFGFLNLIWKLTFNSSLISNDFLYVLPIFIFLSLRPTRLDLRFLPYFGAVIILIVFTTALVKYQNPLHPYRGVDFGLGSVYQNRIWGFFGMDERFRGPYAHPNQLGINITFLSLLVLLRPTKFYFAIIPFSFTLLFLASSRTSILALFAGLLARIYFDFTTRTQKRSSVTALDYSKNRSAARNGPRKILAILGLSVCVVLVVREIVKNNTTGTGRLESYTRLISEIRNNFILGQGPSLVSVNNTENTILTLVSYYGLMGIALLLVVTIALILGFRSTSDNSSHLFQITLITFLIAGAGESLLTGGSIDTGLYYFLVLLSITRGEPVRNRYT